MRANDLRDNAADLCAADRPDGVLAARTAAEIVTGNNNIAGLYLLDKIRIEVFHAVRRKFGLVIGIQIPRRNYLIRIYMISFIYMCFSHAINLHLHFINIFSWNQLIFLRLRLPPRLPGLQDTLRSLASPYGRQSCGLSC